MAQTFGSIWARILVSLAFLVVVGAHVSPATAGYTAIYSFCSKTNCTDGFGPNVGVIRDTEGNLYGAAGGGANNQGVIFELTRKGDQWKEKVLYNFCSEANCTDGTMPYTPLVMDTSGDVYGVTLGGGLHSSGNIFELVPNAKRT